jgi:hypothetical protein
LAARQPRGDGDAGAALDGADDEEADEEADDEGAAVGAEDNDGADDGEPDDDGAPTPTGGSECVAAGTALHAARPAAQTVIATPMPIRRTIARLPRARPIKRAGPIR